MSGTGKDPEGPTPQPLNYTGGSQDIPVSAAAACPEF